MAQPLDYFAWGTLLDQRTMRDVAGDWDRMLPARLPGYRLRFAVWSERWSGAVAAPERAPDASVYGAIYRILTPQMADILAAHPGYRQANVSVETAEGMVPAVTLEAERPETGLAASPGYLRAVEEGYRQMGFRPEILDALRRWAAGTS